MAIPTGRNLEGGPQGELLDRWLDLKAMTVEASTANGYRWITEHFVRPTFGDRKVASIRTLELDHWYQQLRAVGGAGGRPLSGRTVRLCHTVMRQSLEQARKWGLIARNPAVDATPPSACRTEIKPPTIAQVHDLPVGWNSGRFGTARSGRRVSGDGMVEGAARSRQK